MNQILLDTPYSILSNKSSHIHSSHVYKNYSNVICCNCGGLGHVYARCNHPITSYGVICYRLVYDDETNCVFPEYLMVQRKDSLAYVEFMRGKYDLQNITYLRTQMFSNMTEEEREKLRENDFETLWGMVWTSHNGKNFMKEYSISKVKFDKLKQGYQVKSEKGIININLNYLLNNTQSELTETEWGFPKGRRSFSDEDDRHCAIREFREETGIQLRNIRIVRELKPFEEVFSGSNKVRYKHVYYIAKYYNISNNKTELFDPNNKHQAREIRDVRWFKFKDALDKIRTKNVERRELLTRINRLILKNIHL